MKIFPYVNSNKILNNKQMYVMKLILTNKYHKHKKTNKLNKVFYIKK